MIRRKLTWLQRQAESRNAVVEAARGWAKLLGGGPASYSFTTTATDREGRELVLVVDVHARPADEVHLNG